MLGRVTENGPAAAAGLQTGDVVKAANGAPIANWEDFERRVAASRGRPLELRIAREGQEKAVTVTPRHATFNDPIFKEAKETWELGVGPQLTPQIGSVNGGSPAEKGGLRAGDLVVAVAGQPVYTPEELMQSIQKRAGQTFGITVERDGKPATLDRKSVV